MKFTIDGAALRAALHAVAPVIAGESVVPILRCVRLRAADGRIDVTATDLEIIAEATAEADVTTPGTAVVPFVALRPIHAGGRVAIASDGDAITIEIPDAGAAYKIRSMPADEWPAVTVPAPCETYEPIARAVARVAVAASSDETRYNLNGVHVGADAAVATDGHRMHVVRIEAPVGWQPVIVPVPIARLAAAEGASIGRASDGRVVLRLPGAVYAARPIDGEFPDWHKVMPTGEDRARLRVPGPTLGAAIAAVYAGVVRGDVPIAAIEFDETHLQIAYVSAEGDTAEATIPVETKPPATRRFGVNLDYLRDAIEGLASVELLIDDDVSPIEVRDPNDDTYRAVVMPARV